MSTDAKAGPSVARARVPLVDKERATPAQLAVWDRIAQSRGRVAGPFAALQKRFGLEGLIDLTATMGYYAMIACALNAFAIEPTPGEPPLPV